MVPVTHTTPEQFSETYTMTFRIKNKGISTKRYAVDIPFSIYAITVYFRNSPSYSYLKLSITFFSQM